jgi:hypothetical protein
MIIHSRNIVLRYDLFYSLAVYMSMVNLQILKYFVILFDYRKSDMNFALLLL